MRHVSLFVQEDGLKFEIQNILKLQGWNLFFFYRCKPKHYLTLHGLTL